MAKKKIDPERWLNEETVGCLIDYEGELGKFIYDDGKFEVAQKNGETILQYIGTETDGYKIHIPEGLKTMNWMFANNDKLESAADMPNSIESADYAYFHCTSIVKTNEVWSEKLLSIVSMFEGCKSLMDVYKMPPSIKTTRCAFKDCISMQKCMITLPADMIDAESMYEGCISLTQSPKILMGCKNCRRMFANCVKLKTAPQLHKECEDVTEMYLGARNLVAVPAIPHDARMKIYGIEELRPNVSEYPTKGKNKERKEAKKRAIKAKKARAKRARQEAKLAYRQNNFK